MPAEKTLNDLFLDTFQDIYFAEKQILKALPKMARAAQGQIDRLEQVFELLGKSPRGKEPAEKSQLSPHQYQSGPLPRRPF